MRASRQTSRGADFGQLAEPYALISRQGIDGSREDCCITGHDSRARTRFDDKIFERFPSPLGHSSTFDRAPAMTQDKPPASPPPRPARAAGSASHRMESVGMGSFRGAGTAPAVVVLLTFRCKLGSARVATGRWTLIGN